MRLWHYELIKVLPKQQLLGQWRECVLIAKEISDKGTPNHILVNKVINYQITEFRLYCDLVMREMKRREYNVSDSSINKINKYIGTQMNMCNSCFPAWHNNRYLKQCYYNLQEKHDCGGIDDMEWNKIENFIKEMELIYEL